LLNRDRRIRRGNQFGDDLAGDLDRLLERKHAGAQVPNQAGGDDDQKQAGHDREIYLQIEASHFSH